MVGGGKPLITPHHSHRPSYACCWLQLPTPAPHSLSVSVHFHSQLSASVRPGPPELCSSTMTPACVCGVHMNLKIFTLKSGEWWTWCVVQQWWCRLPPVMILTGRGRKLSAGPATAWHWHGITGYHQGISVTVTWIMSTFFQNSVLRKIMNI